MTPLEIILTGATAALVVLAAIISFTNRITKLETKMDWLLEWVICLDGDHKEEDKIDSAKRKHLKHRIENELNGNSLCGKH